MTQDFGPDSFKKFKAVSPLSAQEMVDQTTQCLSAQSVVILEPVFHAHHLSAQERVLV